MAHTYTRAHTHTVWHVLMIKATSLLSTSVPTPNFQATTWSSSGDNHNKELLGVVGVREGGPDLVGQMTLA